MEAVVKTPKSATISRTTTTRQVSNLSTRSQSSIGSPRLPRKPVNSRGNTPKSATNGLKRNDSNQIDTTPNSTRTVRSTPGSIKSRDLNSTPDKKSSDLNDAKTNNGHKRVPRDVKTENPPSKNLRKDLGDPITRRRAEDYPSKKKPEDLSMKKKTDDLMSKGKSATTNKVSKSTIEPKKRVRDLNRNSPTERPVRSDSTDIEAASKLVSAKVCELHTQLSNNNVITASLSNFLDAQIDTFVVLPIGRFSQNSQSLWRAAMMELLLQITTPRIKVFYDPTMIELEKESLRIHSFYHKGDKPPPDTLMEEAVRAPSTTLFYIPRSDLPSVEAILRLNDDKLNEIFIIGHSLMKLAKDASPKSILRQNLHRLVEEKFAFNTLSQTAFTSVFNDLRGHRFLPREVPVETASIDTDHETVISEEILTTASGRDGSEPNRVPTLLTIGAICCGAGLAWMFINKR